MNIRISFLNRCVLYTLVALVLAACATGLTNTIQEGDPTLFAAAHSYAITSPEPPAATAQGAQLRETVESQITKSLEGKGYQRADAGTAQLKVSYQLVPLGTRLRDERVPAAVAAHVNTGPGDPYGGYRPPAGADASEKFGMLMLSVTDAKTGSVVWQGSSEGVVTSRRSMLNAARQATSEILAKAPKAAQ